MSIALLPPPRPRPTPVPGTFLSLSAHGALVLALVGGGGGPAGELDPVTSRSGAGGGRGGGERVHWVGLRDGPAADAPPRSPDAPLPSAYVVPGRAVGSAGPSGTPGPRGEVVGDERSRGFVPEVTGSADLPSAPAPTPPRPRAGPLPVRLPAIALPTITLPTADASFLVAGVLSAAPDLARSVSRPEDFAPPMDDDEGDEESLSGRSGAVVAAVLRTTSRVAELPVPLVSNPPPPYPRMLERMGVGGEVVVEFMIDSTGVVDLATLHVVQSTNTLFTQAVRHVLPQLRFLPAQLRRRSVAVIVRQPFVFKMGQGR